MAGPPSWICGTPLFPSAPVPPFPHPFTYPRRYKISAVCSVIHITQFKCSVTVCATASFRRRHNRPISLPIGPIFVNILDTPAHSISLHSTIHIIGCARIRVLISNYGHFLSQICYKDETQMQRKYEPLQSASYLNCFSKTFKNTKDKGPPPFPPLPNFVTHLMSPPPIKSTLPKRFPF
jgi:hypothetical protein